MEILALPISAPWMAVKEAIDYFRAVDPEVAIPIHEKVLANPAMVYGLLSGSARRTPAGSTWTTGISKTCSPRHASWCRGTSCTMMAVRCATAASRRHHDQLHTTITNIDHEPAAAAGRR